jgi:hypothetical protein
VSTSIALLQGALGGVFLLILFFAVTAGVVVIGAVTGGALSDKEGEESTGPILPPGTLLAASALGLGVLGAFYSLSLTFVGIMLGMMAYYRGARLLGGVVSALSFAAIFVGYYLGSGGPYQFAL